MSTVHDETIRSSLNAIAASIQALFGTTDAEARSYLRQLLMREAEPLIPPSDPRDFLRRCAHRRCRNDATQAFDVFSWFKAERDQIPAHYEVCDKHAEWFIGHSFDSTASKRVAEHMVSSA